MTRTLAIAVFLLGLTIGGASVAAPLENLQQARIPVADQGADTRSDALGTALGRVLARLTGQPDVAGRKAVAGLLEKPERYVQSYRYEQPDEGGLELVVTFDGRGLRRALVEREIPIWQPDRPSVLAWVAYDGGDGRYLVSAEEGAPVREAMRDAAKEVGVPLLFPLMDLQDQGAIRFNDVAGDFTDPVLAASRRYGTPLVLNARIRRRNGRWAARWTLYRGGTPSTWQTTGDALEPLFAGMAQGLAQRLRQDYAVLPDLTPSRFVNVRIVGIDSLADYARAEKVLRSGAGITDARVDRIEGDGVRFRLVVNVSGERVIRDLDLNPALARVEHWAPDTKATPSRPSNVEESGSAGTDGDGEVAVTAAAAPTSVPEALDEDAGGAGQAVKTPTDPIYRLAQ
ncbi:MAG: DUF2066 domain-containing protein [Ectothiorhodospiraceae bacterium]|jgi:hypothetical protein